MRFCLVVNSNDPKGQEANCHVMCRCVVVMGMPFPNPTDPELCERMRYLDASTSGPPQSLQPAGQLQTPDDVPAACARPSIV